jgi:Holliday junction resolvase RusA-like endonuclease
MTITIPGAPVAKPRMSQRDRWKERPCVLAYRDFCDRARKAAGIRGKMRLVDPIIVTVTAYFGFPRSINLSRQRELRNSPHTGRVDADNVLKSINDALFENDHLVCRATVEKLWDDGQGPRVVVEID